MEPSMGIGAFVRCIFAWSLLLAVVTNVPCVQGAQLRATPRVLWAQRPLILFLKLVTPDLIEDSVEISLNDTQLHFVASSPSQVFEIRLSFFRWIEPQQCEWEIKSGEVQFTITKKFEWIYWPRLLREPKGTGPLWDHIGVDWRRWKAENERSTASGPGEDDDWHDEDFALTKKASFPLEQWSTEQVPLLNASSLPAWLEGKPVSTVLFFDRADRRSMTSHALFASISFMMKDHVPMARVDKQANSLLMKKMHVTHFPSAHIFLGTGETLPFDTTAFKRGRELLDFLFRQTQPAWGELHNLTQATEFLSNYSRVAVGLFDKTSAAKGVARKEKQFDYMAREFRVRVDLVPLVFAKLNASLWDPQDYQTFLDRYNLTAPYTGLVMDKHSEDAHHYVYKWTHKLLTGWTYNTQFNYLERIDANNFQEFRQRQKPMLYVMLGEEEEAEAQKAFLEQLKETTAKKYWGTVSFVWTHVKLVKDDIMQHLRCDYNGKTYAVLEDFVNEYMYCATPDLDSNLTVTRLEKLVAGYLEQSLKPDKVKSEKVPDAKKNRGPVYKVVSDNLMETVLDAEKDVVLHVYSRTDEKWEDTAFEMEKYAEAVEDIATIKVVAMEGLMNERPTDFPDLGYFPCTWMFPMYDKYTPRAFNASAGVKAERLLWWTHFAASFPLAADMLPPKPKVHYGIPVGHNGIRPAHVDAQYITGLKAESESGRAPIRGIWKFEDNNVTEEDLFGNKEERLKEQEKEEAAEEKLALEAQATSKAAAPKEEL